jgi:hypothetical protein
MLSTFFKIKNKAKLTLKFNALKKIHSKVQYNFSKIINAIIPWLLKILKLEFQSHLQIPPNWELFKIRVSST